MTSMPVIRTPIISRPNINGRRRVINGRGWRVVNRWRRRDVHRLRRDRATDDCSDTKSQDTGANSRAIARMSRARE